MSNDTGMILISIILVSLILGIIVGQSYNKCDTNPNNVEYWKSKYNKLNQTYQTCLQDKQVLQSNLFKLLVNSYGNKIIWNVSGLSSYKLVCPAREYVDIEIPKKLNELIDKGCI